MAKKEAAVWIKSPMEEPQIQYDTTFDYPVMLVHLQSVYGNDWDGKTIALEWWVVKGNEEDQESLSDYGARYVLTMPICSISMKLLNHAGSVLKLLASLKESRFSPQLKPLLPTN
jgi:hypothetical protein